MEILPAQWEIMDAMAVGLEEVAEMKVWWSLDELAEKLDMEKRYVRMWVSALLEQGALMATLTYPLRVALILERYLVYTQRHLAWMQTHTGPISYIAEGKPRGHVSTASLLARHSQLPPEANILSLEEMFPDVPENVREDMEALLINFVRVGEQGLTFDDAINLCEDPEPAAVMDRLRRLMESEVIEYDPMGLVYRISSDVGGDDDDLSPGPCPEAVQCAHEASDTQEVATDTTAALGVVMQKAIDVFQGQGIPLEAVMLGGEVPLMEAIHGGGFVPSRNTPHGILLASANLGDDDGNMIVMSIYLQPGGRLFCESSWTEGV